MARPGMAPFRVGTTIVAAPEVPSAERRAYFDLQLRFATALSARTGLALTGTVTWCTNLHRRFGLGMLRPGVEPEPAWWRYLAGLAERGDHDDRLDWTMTCFAAAPPERPPPGSHRFGCFACDAPGPDGVVKLHFNNVDGDGVSPLHGDKVAQRRAELTEMIGFVRAELPAARCVRGTSWLYHLEAYRRLFPPDYVASRRAPAAPLHFHGSSSWGQFLDHRGRVKPAPRQRMLDNLAQLDPARLREAFPLPALLVTASVGSFFAHFGIQ